MCVPFIYSLKAGSLEYYDKVYDRVSTKNEKHLSRINRVFHKVTTTDDHIIRKVYYFSRFIYLRKVALLTSGAVKNSVLLCAPFASICEINMDALLFAAFFIGPCISSCPYA
jgi:hypothetical protein